MYCAKTICFLWGLKTGVQYILNSFILIKSSSKRISGKVIKVGQKELPKNDVLGAEKCYCIKC